MRISKKSIEDLVQDGEIVDRQVHGLAEAIVRDRKGSACENDSSDSSSDLERDKISKAPLRWFVRRLSADG